MIIGIDGNEANVEKKVGISEYAFKLLVQFRQFRIQNSEFRIYLKEKPREELPKENENWKYRIVKPSKLWTQIGLPIDLQFHKVRPSVFFSPTHYAPRFSPVPTVVSIMDLSFLYFPEMFRASDLYQLKNWTTYSIKKASKVLTISNASKDDIIKEYGIDEAKIVVTYPGIKFKIQSSKFKIAMQNSKLILGKYKISSNYILFVGTLQPRKNIVRLIEAFSKVQMEKFSTSSNNKSLQLVIVGKKGWKYEDILQAPAKFNVKEQVKFLEFVSDEELTVLYKNAICFVLPSLYEGFGLPVLEAMQYGCPVITSNVSSLPEAGGDAALYVNPEDVGDIASKIVQLISDKKLRKELVDKGRKQVQKFSWEKTAKETLKVLEEVAGGDYEG